MRAPALLGVILLFLAASLVALPLSGAESVAFELILAERARPADVAVGISLTEREARAAPQATSRMLSAGSVIRVEVPVPGPGTWELDLRAEGFLREVRSFAVGEGANVDLGLVRLQPSGWISGEVAVGTAQLPADARLAVRYAPSPSARGPGEPETGSAVCSLVESRFRCEVRAGTLDYSLRIPGFASRYFWEQEVRHAESRALGVVSFPPGASLVGFVEAEGETRFDPRKCRVTLDGVSPRGAEHRETPASRTAPVTGPRGFFQLTGLSPGLYDLTALHPGLATDRRQVAIRSTAEATLRAPLRIGPLATLEVVVSPRLDPHGGRWKVVVSTPVEGTEVVSIPGDADERGVSRFGLRRGTAPFVLVETSQGEKWDQSRVELDRPFVRHSLELAQHPVSGRVRLGEAPLRATLFFGGRHGGSSVRMESDEGGEFEGLLPRLGRWEIEVHAESPSVTRTVERSLEAEGDGTARVDLQLEEGRLHGTVRNEDGTVRERVLVHLSPLGSKDRGMADQPATNGTFDFGGLSTGRFRLWVETADSGGEEVVELTEEQSSREVDLVVRKRERFRGKLVSPAGTGVPFATVQPMPFSGTAQLFPSRVTTDENGDFDVLVPKGTPGGLLLILANGFALRVFEFHEIPKERVPVSVDGVGGVLRLLPPRTSDWVPALRHRGAVFPVAGLDFAPGVTKSFDADGLVVTVPLVEPGDYTLCPGSESTYVVLRAGGLAPGCVTGLVSARGDLTLDGRAPAREP